MGVDHMIILAKYVKKPFASGLIVGESKDFKIYAPKAVCSW